MTGTPEGSLPRRRLIGRLGVTKGVTGKGGNYRPADHGLITVHEFVSERDTGNGRGNLAAPMRSIGTQWRHVPIEGIVSLRTGGKEFAVTA
jgi:hypothetical protein